MTAYRLGPGERRAELLTRRSELLAEPLSTCSAACRRELEGLRRRLETAEDDPLDHVQEGLRLYGMTLEAGRAAGQQQGLKRRGVALAACAFLGSLVAMVGGRLGFQWVDHDQLVNPCINGDYDGRRHEVIRHDGLLGLAFLCEARTDADCTEPCAREGDCVAQSGRCIPRTDAHCRQSEICRYHGECSRRGALCLADSHEDCGASEGCRLDGACSFDGARCRPMSDGDCKASARCVEEGFCRLGFDGCEQDHAPVDECARMSHCVRMGLCAPEELPEGCSNNGVREASDVTASAR